MTAPARAPQPDLDREIRRLLDVPATDHVRNLGQETSSLTQNPYSAGHGTGLSFPFDVNAGSCDILLQVELTRGDLPCLTAR